MNDNVKLMVESPEMFEFVSVADKLIKGKIDTEEKKQLLHDVVEALHIVYNQKGESLIPDHAYDTLFELNKEYNGVTLIGVQSDSIRKYQHKYPQLRGTVDKIHFIYESDKDEGEKRKSYEKWISNIERLLGRSLKGQSIRASLKVDGVSAVIEGEKGHSIRVLKRGDTDNNEAENIPLLENRYFPDLKDVNEFGLKTELYMSYDNFIEFKKKYGEFNSPRSAITSIVNSDDVDEAKIQYLTIYDIEQIIDGVTVMPNNVHFELPDATNLSAVDTVVKELQSIASNKGIPADGVVIRFINEDICKELGRDGAINKYEVGYKFPPVRVMTYLKDVVFSMGKNGSFTPVAKIEPIIMSGNKISNISLGSIPRFDSLDLRHGQPVYVTYDVIPYMYDASPEEKEPYTDKIEAIHVCNTCNEPLTFEDGRLYCLNYECFGNIRGRLLNWTTKIGVDGVSKAIIEDLIKKIGITRRIELHSLHKYRKEISELPGYGAISTEKIIEAFAKKSALPFDLILGSLGIRNVGRSITQSIMNHFTMAEFFKMFISNDFSPITKIKGIGDSVVQSLNNWFSDECNVEEYNALMNNLKVLEPRKTVDNHTILFTKVRDYDFQKYLEEKGYNIADKYKKDVDVVIAKGESSKTEKARKDGKMVISLEEAYNLYKYKNK